MKVLLINSVCGIGSTGRICTDLYDILIEQGHECIIAYGRGEAPVKYRNYKIGGKFNNCCHVFETRLLDNHGFSSRYATKRFIRFIEEYNPDVIHIHNIHGYFLNLEILCKYLSKTKAKIIWTLHDGWLFSGHSAHPQLNDNGVPIFKPKDVNTKREYPKSYVNFEKRNYHRKKKALLEIPIIQFVTPSNWLAQTARKTFLKKYSFEVINNGIDLNKFYPDMRKSFLEKKVILGVASFWNSLKGLDVFNELADILDSNEYKIILVGSVKEKVNKKIEVVNKTNSIDELRRIYSTATYFVNPTKQDNYPTTNLEAQACNIPVITTNVGGTSETVIKGKGIVINNIDDIIYSIEHKDEWFNVKKKIPLEFYSKETAYRKYLNLFNNLLSKEKSSKWINN